MIDRVYALPDLSTWLKNHFEWFSSWPIFQVDQYFFKLTGCSSSLLVHVDRLFKLNGNSIWLAIHVGRSFKLAVSLCGQVIKFAFSSC